MGVNTYTSRLLWDALTSIVQANRIPKPSDLGPATARVRDALLAVGSETPDNVSLVQHIEFGAIADGSEPVTWLGPMISGKSILLSDIVWALEEEAIPHCVRESIPSLSEEEWSAAIRIIVLILTALERPVRETGTDTVNPFFAQAPKPDNEIRAEPEIVPDTTPVKRDILDIERPILTQYVETRHFSEVDPRVEREPVPSVRPVVERSVELPKVERPAAVSTVRTHSERPVPEERSGHDHDVVPERIPLKKKLVRLSDISPEKIDEMWNDGDRPSPSRRAPVPRTIERGQRDEYPVFGRDDSYGESEPVEPEYQDELSDYPDDSEEPSDFSERPDPVRRDYDDLENAPRSMRGRKARRETPEDDDRHVSDDEDLDLSLDDVRPGSINDIWDSREIDLGDAAKRYESYYNDTKPKKR